MTTQFIALLALAGGIGIVVGYIIGSTRVAILRSTVSDKTGEIINLKNLNTVLSSGVRDLTQERDAARENVDDREAVHVARLEAQLANVIAERDAIVTDEAKPEIIRQESRQYRAMRNRAKAAPRERNAWNTLARAVNAGRGSGAFKRFTKLPGKVSEIKTSRIKAGPSPEAGR